MIFAIHQHESATGIHAPPILNPTHLPSYSVYMSIPIFQFIPPLCFLISHASKIMLKILQARLQQYVNWELQYVQFGFRKGSRTRDQIADFHWIMEKAEEFQKNIYFCFIDYAKAFDCVDHKKNVENSAVTTGLEKVSFHSNPKERQCQRMLKLPHNCTHLTR